MSDQLDKEIDKLGEVTKTSLQVLEAAFDRYNDLVSNLITAIDIEYTDMQAMKIRLLSILKESLNEVK